MTLQRSSFRTLALLQASLLVFASPAFAQDTTVIEEGETVTETQDLEDEDVLDVEEGGTLSVEDDDAIKIRDTTDNIIIRNAGLIESTDDGGRAIDEAGDPEGERNISITNLETGIIRSEGDAIRIDNDFDEGTLRVDNYGLIESTVGGQAIDFRSIESPEGDDRTIIINNYAGGEIRSTGADAVRPGQGATVNNAGLIFAGGVDGDNHDAIDWQQSEGVVNNLDGGVISGFRHGIASDITVTVNNAEGGLIEGRNGGAINSDGTGIVINRGTLRAQTLGGDNSDADAIDIDLFGYVENYGLIEAGPSFGVDRGGDINVSEAITITRGATIINHETGIIRSAQNGVFTNSTFGADADIRNAGLISGESIGVAMNGFGENTLVNSGTIEGGDFAIRLNGFGNNTLVLQEGSVINGRVAGSLNGTDIIVLEDGATLDTAETIDVVRVAGDATIFGTTQATEFVILEDSTLTIGQGGTTGMLAGAITNSGNLAFDRSDNTSVDNIISGTGNVIKLGDNLLALTGVNDYSGDTIISGGTLRVDRSLLNSTVVVEEGGTLSGLGTVGGIDGQGGTIAPDAAFGTLNVAGDATFDADTTFAINVNEAGESNALNISGSAELGGANLSINAQDGFFTSTEYQILTADGGVSGTFGDVTSNFAFVDAGLDYGDQNVTLTLERNGTEFAAFATTDNARNVANAIIASGFGTDVFDRTLFLAEGEVDDAFTALAGDFYVGLNTGLLNQNTELRRMLQAVPGLEPNPGISIWADGVVGSANLDGDDVVADLDADYTALIGGLAYGTDALTAKLGGGFGRTEFDGSGNAEADQTYLTASLAYQSGGWGAEAGGLFSWNDIETQRDAALGTLNAGVVSETDGTTRNLFAKTWYSVDFDTVSVVPFADLSSIRVKTDGLTETGSATALRVGDLSRDITLGKLGVALTGEFGGDSSAIAFRPHASVAYRKAWGDTQQDQSFTFVDTGVGFDSEGAVFGDDAVEIDLGVSVGGERWTLGALYGRTEGDAIDSQSGRLRLTVGF